MYLEDFEKAKKILGLKDAVSINYLKKIYRKLMKEYHTDLNQNHNPEAEERTREINWAYKLLTDFCQGFEIPLDPKNLPRLDYKHWWNEQFGTASFKKENDKPENKF